MMFLQKNLLSVCVILSVCVGSCFVTQEAFSIFSRLNDHVNNIVARMNNHAVNFLTHVGGIVNKAPDVIKGKGLMTCTEKTCPGLFKNMVK